MAHSHSHGPSRPLTEADEDRQRKALRIMLLVLIPIGVWTLVGLILMWPGDISDRIQTDSTAWATEGVTIVQGEVAAVADADCSGIEGTSNDQSKPCADVTVKITDGPDVGQQTQIQLTSQVYESGVDIGDRLNMHRIPVEGQPALYQFADFVRVWPLIMYAVVFMVAVAIVARLRGVVSMLGLVFAGFILIKFMFPALIAGSNPILVGLVGSSAIMFVVLYASHGFSTRTTTALIGTLFGLGLSALLGWIATEWAHLTGVASEDDFTLSASVPGMKLTSVVLCGMIVASLGALNDVTITQASAVWELAESDGDGKIFRRAMRIGRDHIASSVYTLAFATAGASLSVLLLISIYQQPFGQIVQHEAFATEIFRTLVGSIGLVLAIPLTTAVGAVVVRAGKRDDELRPASPGRGDRLVDAN